MMTDDPVVIMIPIDLREQFKKQAIKTRPALDFTPAHTCDCGQCTWEDKLTELLYEGYKIAISGFGDFQQHIHEQAAMAESFGEVKH